MNNKLLKSISTEAQKQLGARKLVYTVTLAVFGRTAVSNFSRRAKI
jgi:hypothetical protein